MFFYMLRFIHKPGSPMSTLYLHLFFVFVFGYFSIYLKLLNCHHTLLLKYASLKTNAIFILPLHCNTMELGNIVTSAACKAEHSYPIRAPDFTSRFLEVRVALSMWSILVL